MKKLSVVLILAIAITGTIFLTSAGEEMSPEQKEQANSIDQQVADKVTTFKSEKDAECKARALEAGKVQADSIIAAKAAMAAKTGKPMAKKPVVKKPAAKPVVKPATVGSGKPKLGGGNESSTTVGSGKPKLGVDPAKPVDDKKKTTVGSGKPKLGGGGN